jgi:pimeloyl-ACP methyl ester carboxylesterase
MGEWIDVCGNSIYVSRHDGEGVPVLLINGIGAHHAMWGTLVDGLPGRTTIAFDPPGIGRSPLPRGPLAISDYAEIAAGVAEGLGYDQVDVIGYSFGGAVAQQLAHQEPERVRRLVLLGTSCGWGGIPGTPGAVAIIGSPLRYYSKAFYYATACLITAGDAERDPAFLRRAGERRRQFPPSWQGYATQLSALSMWTSLPWLETLQPPTLVVTGDADPIIPPANGALLAHTIPTARLRIQEGEGHFMALDGGSSSIPAIANFLQAKNYASSTAWRTAADVSAEDVQLAIRATRHSAQPLGLLSAFVRAAC